MTIAAEQFLATCVDTRWGLQLEFAALMKRVAAFNAQQRKYGLGAHANPKVTLRHLSGFAQCWNAITPAERRRMRRK
jgi:hypothetical protein